jgi:hypothetical protein
VFLSLLLMVCGGMIPCIIPGVSCVSLVMRFVLLVPTLIVCAWAQSDHRDHRGPGKEIGSGAGDIGKGAAKGAGNLATGTGKGALDLVTLHPINAAASVGKGAAGAGKDVGVGTVKGTGKIGKGIGKAIKKLF